MSRIGLFGGTFDPVHLGHLILAEAALEELRLDQLIFIPAKISPHKIDAPPNASDAERLAMLRLAIKEASRFTIDTRELNREGTSFTIDTVRELQQENPTATFIYLIGEDNLKKLSTWKNHEELQQRVAFAVLRRKIGVRLQILTKLKKMLFFKKLPFVKIHSLTPIFIGRCINISSTEIRERLAKGLSVRYLLPTSVFDYIEKYNLYRFQR